MFDFDYLLTKLGALGLSQILIVAMVFYGGIPSGLNSIGPVFMSYMPDYRCNVPPFDDPNLYDLNETEILALTTPLQEDDDGEYNTCERYNYNASNCVNGSFACLENIDTADTITCVDADGYFYDRSLFTETVVTEMDLVCDKVIYSYVATSIFMFGLLVGSVLFGDLADRLGRKPTLIISSVGCGIGMIGAALSHVYWLYVLFRLLIAFFGYGLTISCFVTLMEIVGMKWRTLVGVGYQMSFAIGYMLLSGIAYGFRDWHNMQWACIVLSFPFGIFLFLIPESPRWLFSMEKDKEGRKITERMAKLNKVEITEEMWEEAQRIGAVNAEKLRGEDQQNKKYSLKDLFRGRGIRRTTLNVMFNWFVNSLVYYGLSLNVGALSGNIFINNVIGGCMELVSYLICILTMDFLGRRILLSIMLLESGLTLIAATIVNEYAGDDEALLTLGTAFSFLGKLGISGSYAIIYNLTTELFPTVVRSNSIGIGSAAARIGGILTPFVIATQNWVTWLPNTIFGIFGIAAGILSLAFPETTNKKMLETLEEAELFYAGKEYSEVDESQRDEKESEFENKLYDVDLSTEL